MKAEVNDCNPEGGSRSVSKHVLLTIVNEHICTCSVNKVVILFLQFITVINMSLLLLLLLLVLLLLFSDLYSIPNILRVVQSRRMKSAGHVACMVKGRVVHRVVVGKPEGTRPLGRPRRRWEDNNKMDLQEVGGVVGTGCSWLRIGTGGGHL